MNASATTTRKGPHLTASRERGPLYALLFLIGTETFLVAPILPSIAHGFDTPVTTASYLVTAYVVVYAVLAPVLGPVTDRHTRKASIATGATIFLLGNVIAAVSPVLLLVAAGRAVAGLGAALAGPAIWAHLTESAPPAERGRAMGRGFACFSLGQVAGVPIGSLIAAAAGWRWAFACIGAAMLVTTGCLSMWGRSDARTGLSSSRSLLSSTRSVWRRGCVRAALLVTLLFQAANLGAYTYIGALLQQHYGLTTGQLGVIGILVGGGSVAGSLGGGRVADRWIARGQSVAELLVVAGLVLAVALAVAVSRTLPGISLAALAIWFVASGAFVTMQQTLLAGTAPDLRATSLAWNNSAMYAGTALGVWLISLGSGSASNVAELGIGFALAAALAATWLTVRTSLNARPVHASRGRASKGRP